MKENPTVMERMTSKPPKWFRYIRNAGIILASASAAILASPVALPAALITLAGYCAVSGAVASAIAQTAVDTE